jgi:ParB/RepB/Spo0J family partition protein
MTKQKLETIPFGKLIESPWNPRKHFDKAEMEKLEASVKAHGQLTPGLVRPVGAKFEIAAGHRRFRAAKAAGLDGFLAVVRELTTAEFCEILTIENDERADVHPLEQAAGYKLLMTQAGYDVAKIAARIQRDHTYVYDRLALLQLNDDLKKLFLEDRFTVSHAVVLARLSSDEQKRASAKPDGSFSGHGSGLWRNIGATLDEDVFPLVPNTVAELEAWIASHLRFDETKVLTEELFPETAEALIHAEESGARVIAVTYDSYLPGHIERKDDDKIYTSKFWKRADGLEGSKLCEYTVLGIVRAGKARGSSLGVCIRRDACKVHWPTEARAAEQKKKAKKNGTKAPTPKQAAKEQVKTAKQRAAEKKANERVSRIVAAVPLIEAALTAAADAPTKKQVEHAREVLGGKEHAKDSVEQLLVRRAMRDDIHDNLEWMLTNEHHGPKIRKTIGAWGVDVEKLVAGVTVEMCTYCGCSEGNPCEIRTGTYDRHNCAWVSRAPAVCSNPACVEQAKAADVKLDNAVTAHTKQFEEESSEIALREDDEE